MSKKKETVVISFRVPVDLGRKVDRQARKEKAKRAQLVEKLFTPAFEAHLTASKQTA